MLKEERYDKILEILKEETYIHAQELAQRLFVSMPTIRRDLSVLDSRGLIVRSHGGAKKLSTENIVTPLDFRKAQNHAEKKRIAKKAAELIREGDIVFIDASTTALYMGEYLDEKRNITVVTNAVPLSLILTKKGIRTYCTGGETQKNSLGYTGSIAQLTVKSFNYDYCFFSVCAVNSDGQICDTSFEENMIRTAAIQNSKRSVFLCDGTKAGLCAPYNLTDINEVTYVVSNVDSFPNLKEAEKIIKA